jgi:hypothetical protein
LMPVVLIFSVVASFLLSKIMEIQPGRVWSTLVLADQMGNSTGIGSILFIRLWFWHLSANEFWPRGT